MMQDFPLHVSGGFARPSLREPDRAIERPRYSSDRHGGRWRSI